jgi:hypothetical protein
MNSLLCLAALFSYFWIVPTARACRGDACVARATSQRRVYLEKSVNIILVLAQLIT